MVCMHAFKYLRLYVGTYICIFVYLYVCVIIYNVYEPIHVVERTKKYLKTGNHAWLSAVKKNIRWTVKYNII